MKKIFTAVFVCAFMLSACNAGGTVSNTPSPSATSTTTPTVTQSVPITGQSANAAFPVTLSSAVTQAAGISNASFTLPVALPANTTVTANSGQPSSVLTPFSVSERVLSSFREAQSTSIPNATARLFFVFNSPTNISASGNYQFAFTLTGTPSGTANYYVSFFDGQQWRANATGSPASISGSTLTFSGTFPAGLVVSGNTSYALALYSLPQTSTGVYTTATSGTAQNVIGLIDGSVTLSPPLSTTAVNINYTSTQNAPAGIPSLKALSGVGDVPGYILVTPQTNVTFAAGQSITISHPVNQNGANNSSNTSTSGSNQTCLPSGQFTPGPTGLTGPGSTTGTTGSANSSSSSGITSGGATPGSNLGGNGSCQGINSGASSGSGSSPTGVNNPPHIAIYDPSSSTPAWLLGGGTYSTNGVTEQLTQTLFTAITLKAGVTYYFGVYTRS